MAGPNEGGTLILHANPSLVFTSDIQDYCGMSALDSCAAAVTSVEWDPGKRIVFHVIAAFPVGSSPRLKALSFGIDFDSTKFVLAARGTCADFEIPDGRWPTPGSGTSQSWTTGTQTGLLTEAYWIVGYAYSEQETADSTSVALIPHPVQHGVFVDDAFPSEVDTIAAYGRLGFGMPGALPCPAGGGDIVWVTVDDFDDMDGQSDESEPPGDEGHQLDSPPSAGDLTFVEMASSSAETYAAIYRALKSDYGLRVLIGIVPDALICRTDNWQRSALIEDERVSRVTVEAIQTAPGYLLPGDPAFAEGVWNLMLLPLPADTSRTTLFQDTEGLYEEVVPQRYAEDKIRQTSTYMMGDVGVSLLFMESDSTAIDSCAALVEDWTPDELTIATANITRGYLRLVDLAPPGANLTFTVQDTILPTDAEPIKEAGVGITWKTDAMDDLGVPPDSYYGDRIYFLNNRQREQFGWDWWFTTFVVRDVCDPDHQFPQGTAPCGYGGGPQVVITYYCSNSPGMPPNTNELLTIPSHETCHVFGAADEYRNAGECDSAADCPRVYGYLRQPNDNCYYCASPQDTTCLMSGMPYAFTICPSTGAQIGWKDTDGDGICDPIDHPASDMSMMVGEGDSIGVGDWVDIYHGSTWVRRLAASDRTADRGRMLWDGIDSRGDSLPPGDDYLWRWRDRLTAHEDSLISDTEPPTLSSELLISRGPAPDFVDTLSFSLSDPDTRGAWVRATATSGTGTNTRVIADEFMRASDGSAPSTMKTFRLGPDSGYTTMTVCAWDVGQGGSDSVAVPFWPSAGVAEHVYVPELVLSRGRPNPSGTWVAWDVRQPSGGKLNLCVVGVDGRTVKSWPERTIPTGVTRVLWDGRDDRGAQVASGRYFLVVTDQAGNARSNAATIVR